ncbi:hypothetical protein CPT_Morttis_257 [Acinetobacter phage Morttis]|nr:hypothetical protein CPT_Maestro_262 [Acinetobacter phage Maestro]QQM18743.1 hypothetical protein CPT_Morttis_257 [Acinetobacter phage Morttis]
MKYEDIKVGQFFHILLERGYNYYERWMVIFKNPHNSTVVCSKIRTLPKSILGKYGDPTDVEVLDGVMQFYPSELQAVLSYNNEAATIFDVTKNFKFIIKNREELTQLREKYGSHRFEFLGDKIEEFPYYYVMRDANGSIPPNVSKDEYDNDIAIPFKIHNGELVFDMDANALHAIVGNEIIKK